MLRRRLLWIGAGLLALIGVFVAWISFDNDPRVKFYDYQTFTKGNYMAFAVPWGAEGRVMSRWAKYADTLYIDLEKFPGNTAVRFVWPPWTPTGGIAGVWGYMGIVHGNYDGGEPEEPVTPQRVDDIQQLSQTFAWSGDFVIGSADILTEFYLRSNPADNDSKLLEIGWFLHAPKRTQDFVRAAPKIGRYVDPQGLAWHVSRSDKFVTFMRENGEDARAGQIDMLAALRWLKSKKVITGREWYNGVAWGVEPFKGTAKIQLDRWSVTYR